MEFTFLFLKIVYFLWLCWVFVAVHRLSLGAASGGCSLVAVRGLLTVAASPVAEHGPWGAWASVVVARGFGCPAACEILPHQASNSCLLHWQVDS